MSAIVVDGELVHYEVLGRGRPVILLHGMIGSWRYWVPLLQRLQQSYRLYALDLFGFGDSSKSEAHFSLEQQVTLVQAFMEELGLPKAAMIGHGLGALVAVEFARSHPDKVARLLMVSAPLFDPGGLEKRTPAVRLPITLPPRAPASAPPPAPPTAPASSAGAAMRAALAEATRARKPGGAEAAPAVTAPVTAPIKTAPVETAPEPAAAAEPAAPPPAHSALAPIVSQPLETLLGRCYRRGDEVYAKLMVDVAKTDARAPALLAAGYDSGALLDTLRLLPLPLVAVHGDADPIFPPPPEDVWNYLTVDSERVFLPILLPGVRHFPMLEDERFYRVAGDFLEMNDLGKIEIRERWRRRTR